MVSMSRHTTSASSISLARLVLSWFFLWRFSHIFFFPLELFQNRLCIISVLCARFYATKMHKSWTQQFESLDAHDLNSFKLLIFNFAFGISASFGTRVLFCYIRTCSKSAVHVLYLQCIAHSFGVPSLPPTQVRISSTHCFFTVLCWQVPGVGCVWAVMVTSLLQRRSLLSPSGTFN